MTKDRPIADSCGQSNKSLNAAPLARTRPYRRWAFLTILGAIILQSAFLGFSCPWELSGDEAEYWAWSRRLDWSYFTKGPLTALLIRLSTEIVGPTAYSLTGSLMPAVRFPAILLGGLTAWGVFLLGESVLGRARVGFFAVLVIPALPLFRLGGLLMTDDAPLVCAWVWASYFCWRAIARQELNSWIIGGGLGALGVLAKYSMLAFPASVGLFLLLSAQHRIELRRPGYWLMAILTVSGLVPIIGWNLSHDWVALAHLTDRVGLGSDWNTEHLWRILGFLGGEIAVLGGIWWLIGVFGLATAIRRIWRSRSKIRNRPEFNQRDATATNDGVGLSYLVSLWSVTWAACLTAAFRGESEANWAAPSYISLIVLIGWTIDIAFDQREHAPGARTRIKRRTLVIAWTISVLGLTMLQHTDLLYPILKGRIVGASVDKPVPLRRFDPTCRLRGRRALATIVQERLDRLQDEGSDPFIMTPTYTLAASLSFYLQDQPETYCPGWYPTSVAMTESQHDLWHPNPRDDPEEFQGRPCIVVDEAGLSSSYAGSILRHGMFDEVGPTSKVVARKNGLAVGAWNVTVCRGFRGPHWDSEMIRRALKTYATASYFNVQGGTTRGFVRGLYRDLLKQPVTPEDEHFWTEVLDQEPRALVVAKFVIAQEGQMRR